ncbi:hypothetical protein GCM10022211_26990 [Sphingomonas humi]|uniref:Uncharacterized protein n=2 Tax=Sphingomonas humi TaxID=335630 RepID=A0ABP7SF25_9SPHN
MSSALAAVGAGAAEPATGPLWLLGLAYAGMAIGYVALQLLLPWRWRGGWRSAAQLPMAGTGLLIAWSAYAYAQDSNLWPLLLILYLPVGFVYLCATALVKRLAGA